LSGDFAQEQAIGFPVERRFVAAPPLCRLYRIHSAFFAAFRRTRKKTPEPSLAIQAGLRRFFIPLFG
jgi:hypothetical protein